MITQLVLGPTGALFDARGPLPPDPGKRPDLDTEWNGSFIVKSHAGEKGWSLEVAVPRSYIVSGENAPDVRFNVLRYQSRNNTFGALVSPLTFSPELAGVLKLK